jgi:hypothetical protein
MPCSDPRDHKDREQLQALLDAATRAACELAHVMDKLYGRYAVMVSLTPETAQWIQEHNALDAERGNKMTDRIRAKWIVNIKGAPGRTSEISVIREDFPHGFISYGWFGPDKKLISASDHSFYIEQPAWDKLIAVAHEVAAELNSAEASAPVLGSPDPLYVPRSF